MRLIQHIFLGFSLLVLSSACGPDFFDAEIELPTPEHDPVLAISSFITSTDTSFIAARVSRTYGLFEDRPNDDRISDAKVELFENGESLFEYSAVDLSDINYLKLIEGEFGGIGKTYELKVSHPDYPTATGTQVMPTPIPLSTYEFREVEGNDIDGSNGELKITFQDPADEENYYEFIAIQICSYTYIDYYTGEEFTQEYEQPIYFDTETNNDPNIEMGFAYDAILIKDLNFNGQTFSYSPRFYLCQDYYYEPNPNQDRRFRIHWRTVSKEYYNYSKSLRDNLNASENPFAEPVSLFSNMEGGIGAFCLRSEIVYELE